MISIGTKYLGMRMLCKSQAPDFTVHTVFEYARYDFIAVLKIIRMQLTVSSCSVMPSVWNILISWLTGGCGEEDTPYTKCFFNNRKKKWYYFMGNILMVTYLSWLIILKNESALDNII